MPIDLADFERLIRRDPGRRGLISTEEQWGPLRPGDLASAAVDLAENGQAVAIVTGFFIPHADPPSAETDGPPGAALLAAALESIGIRALLITDEPCLAAVRAAAAAYDLPGENVLTYCSPADAWMTSFFATQAGRTLTHLIALERVGPSHTEQSFAAQRRPADIPWTSFRKCSPLTGHGCCHNMRGHIIDGHSADLYRLFDDLHCFRPDVRTIGIGDGGNEIGMGSIPWEELHRRLAGEQAGRIPCRVATDWTIIGGTSNWGGYALAAATLALRDRLDVLLPWNRDHELMALEQVVRLGPAVDGVTGRREATVDGLPFLTYIQPWELIRQLLGFAD